MSQLNNPFVIIFTSPPEHQGCAAAFRFHVMREQMRLFHRGCPGGSVKQSACQCRRLRFSPWAGKIPWRRKRQSTPVLLSGKSHGQRSLVGCSPWACKRVRHDLTTKQQQQAFSYECSLWYNAVFYVITIYPYAHL